MIVKGIYTPARDQEDLSQLQTKAKRQLVDAINEVRSACPVVNPNVIPTPGGGQDVAAQLSVGWTYVDCSGSSSGDSIQLPPAIANSVVQLIAPSSGAELSVFVQNGSSDTINGIIDLVDWIPEQSDGIPGATLIFICPVNGQWFCNGDLD